MDHQANKINLFYVYHDIVKNVHVVVSVSLFLLQEQMLLLLIVMSFGKRLADILFHQYRESKLE